jgi:hypothetical protein
MTPISRLTFFCIIYISFTTITVAQKRHAFSSKSTQTGDKFARYTTFDVGGGSAHYLGDLNPYTDPKSLFRMIRWNAGISATRVLSPRWSVRVGFNYVRIAGDDIVSINDNTTNGMMRFLRNLHFRNDLKELAVMGIYELIPQEKNFKKRTPFGIYIFGGVAAFDHDPKAKLPITSTSGTSEWTRLSVLRTEGQGISANAPAAYSPLQFAIPFGGGIRFKLNQRWNISAEVCVRYTFTDYLDDVSTNYPNLADLKGQISDVAAQMSLRAFERYGAYSGTDRMARVSQLLGIPVGNNPFTPSAFEGTYPNSFKDGSQRGSPNTKDAYITTAIRLHYVITPPIKCPTKE